MGNIINAVTSAKAANTSVAISMAVAKKALDTVQEQGANLVKDMKAMELSVNPGLGGKFDITI